MVASIEFVVAVTFENSIVASSGAGAGVGSLLQPIANRDTISVSSEMIFLINVNINLL